MYGLSEQPWSSAVELVQSNLRVIIQSPGYNVIFFTNDNPPSTQLTTGLTVTALRDVVHSMANRQPGFYEAETHLKIQGHSIGRIWITSIANSPSPISGDVPLSDTNAKTNAPKTYGSSLVKNDLAAGSGKIPDPEDSRFMISYQYEGQTLPELGILTVILDTLADVAQYNSDGPCAYAFGLSSDASIAMHIEPVQGQIMFGWHAARSLNLLVNQLFLVQHRFQEIQFKLFYYGSAVGKGYIMKAGALGGDDDDGLIASN